ncbi:MAG: DUF1295 domain-containing protein [Candidatus Dojkabacteria bacterium]|nr:MAG: DUF1295 domain-containing protein [Candidatus Dojkabacteria bacterium]
MNPFLLLAFILWGYMTCWFIFSLFLKRNDIADIAWGLGFVLMAWLSFDYGTQPKYALLISLLVTIWGIRLALHIYLRNRKKTEDYRYLEWRKTWRHFYIRSYLQVFMLQGVFLYVISLPFLVTNLVPAHFDSLLVPLGVILWTVGFLFESVGDLQLSRFISQPENKGKLMTSGLWKYSRHPNYFGEVAVWWGIFLLAYAVTGNLLLIISPLLITVLLLAISGIPLLEKKYEGRADWEEYKRKTSALFPLPPRK